MQAITQEYTRYMVPQSESGLRFPLEVVIYVPEGKSDLVARVTPVKSAWTAEPSQYTDDDITWEDAAWQ